MYKRCPLGHGGIYVVVRSVAILDDRALTNVLFAVDEILDGRQRFPVVLSIGGPGIIDQGMVAERYYAAGRLPFASPMKE